jgi:hypothetical protein
MFYEKRPENLLKEIIAENFQMFGKIQTSRSRKLKEPLIDLTTLNHTFEKSILWGIS